MLRRFLFWIDELTTREALTFGAKLAIALIVFSALAKSIFGHVQIPERVVSEEQKTKILARPDEVVKEPPSPAGPVPEPGNQSEAAVGHDKSKELFEQAEPEKQTGPMLKEDESAYRMGINNGVNAAISLFGPLGDMEPENPGVKFGKLGSSGNTEVTPVREMQVESVGKDQVSKLKIPDQTKNPNTSMTEAPELSRSGSPSSEDRAQAELEWRRARPHTTTG